MKSVERPRPVAHPRDESDGAILALLASLQEGNYSARITIADSEEASPLVRAGNALAERLDTGRRDMEQEVRARTAELQQLNDDVMRLSEFGNLLQACENGDEAFEVIEHEVGLLFPGLAGALYLFNASRNVLELKASWGDLQLDLVLPREHCWALRRGQQHLVLAQTPRLSCRHTLERWGDSICYPMSAHGETLGMLHLMGRSLQRPGQILLTPGKQRLGITMAEQTALSLANLRMRDSLGQQAFRDPLTGLYNRRFADESMGREVDRARRQSVGLGVLMVDVDHFKRFNDLHGHDAGDAVLASVATALRSSIRSDDIACRYGGEELLVLLTDVDEAGLLTTAETVRSTVAGTQVTHRGTSLPPVTASIGAAMFPTHGEQFIDVLRMADAALYRAKEKGRNQVEMAPAPAPAAH